MKTILISLIFVLSNALSPDAYSGTCSISSDEEAQLLALPYSDFDQSMGKGWRKYADLGCYNDTALLLDKYLATNRAKLIDWQIRVMVWHSGQMYAFDNNYGEARTRFEDSFNPNEPADTPILWNDYVHATIAFLDKDLVTLKRHREAIANGPVFNGKKANLEVVDGLIKCFGKPYSVAYSGCHI